MRALVVLLATAGGVGYSPVAPGTVGTLVALPLVAGLRRLAGGSTPAYLALAAIVAAIAVWAAGRADAIFGEHDSGRIVVDEVAGMAVAGALLPPGWLALAVGFVLFRVFDVWKPFPAGRIDRGVGGGLGVVGDDLVAGLYAGLAARCLLSWMGA